MCARGTRTIIHNSQRDRLSKDARSQNGSTMNDVPLVTDESNRSTGAIIVTMTEVTLPNVSIYSKF